MKTFYSNDFRGEWPVPTAALVSAKDEASARVKFRALFKKHNIPQGPSDKWTVHEFTGEPLMLSRGDY